jgi:hypothetical protein
MAVGVVANRLYYCFICDDDKIVANGFQGLFSLKRHAFGQQKFVVNEISHIHYTFGYNGSQ